MELHAYFADAKDLAQFSIAANASDGRWRATLHGMPRGSYIIYVQTEDEIGAPYLNTGFGLP